jgi:hypothetical protein
VSGVGCSEEGEPREGLDEGVALQTEAEDARDVDGATHSLQTRNRYLSVVAVLQSNAERCQQRRPRQLPNIERHSTEFRLGAKLRGRVFIRRNHSIVGKNPWASP